MAVFGFATGGASVSGPSRVFRTLPFRNYRDPGEGGRRGWVEELADAMGAVFDIAEHRFISPDARAALLDPMAEDTTEVTETLATATQAPTGEVIQDTILDLLCYIAGVPTPTDTNLTVAQKQALAQIGWDLLVRKGTRIRLLALVAALCDSVAMGWTPAAWQWSVMIPDGAPSPGWGTWSPAAGIANTQRPWILPALRTYFEQRIFPAWAAAGIGYSQFRAGFSAAGEPVWNSGTRLNLLAHEHFDAWGAGVPTGWTSTGAATLTQNTADASINHEFTDNCATLDLTAAGGGTGLYLSQSTLLVNNALTHRFQLDYAYRGTPALAKLTVRITDDTNGEYWNPTTEAWQATAYDIPIEPSTTATTRTRYAIDVPMQAASVAEDQRGTASVSIRVGVTSDGTATSQVAYQIYRVALYEKFDQDVEEEAHGERTYWAPLHDAIGRGTLTRAGGAGSGAVLEPAEADRTSYKLVTSTKPTFDYHGALSGRGFRATSEWTNLVKGSNDFGADWTLNNCTAILNQISPIVGETTATATLLAGAAATTFITQLNLVADPSSKSYIAGLWVKNAGTHGAFTDVTLELTASGGVTTFSRTFTVAIADGWQLLPLPAVTFVAGDAGHALYFRVTWGAATTGDLAVTSAYCYDVTGKTGVLYPPVVQTPIGSTDIVGATTHNASITGACLHPLWQRQMVSVAGGLLRLVIVPTFHGTSQTDGTIFDFGESLTKNRVCLRVVAGFLTLSLFDNATTEHSTSIEMQDVTDPSAGAMTWHRDQEIEIFARWSVTTGLDLSAGPSSSQTYNTSSAWAYSDAALAGISVGNNFTGGAGQFDGIVRDVEVILAGTGI